MHTHFHTGVFVFPIHAQPLAMTCPLFCRHRVSGLLCLFPAVSVIRVWVVGLLGRCFNTQLF